MNMNYVMETKKNNKTIPPVKIILDEGLKYRYIFDIYNIPETLCKLN